MNPCAAVSTVSSPPFSRTKTGAASASPGSAMITRASSSAVPTHAAQSDAPGTRGKEDKGVQCRSVEDVQSVMVEL